MAFLIIGLVAVAVGMFFAVVIRGPRWLVGEHFDFALYELSWRAGEIDDVSSRLAFRRDTRALSEAGAGQ